MSKSLKCHGSCGNKYLKDEMIPHGKINYCVNCHANSEAFKKLIEMICTHFKIDAPSGMTVTRIKQYKDTYHYSYAAMYYTLWYMIEIEKKEFDDDKHAVESIKYYYDDASEYYTQQEKIKQSVNLHDFSEKVRVVNVKNRENNNSKFILDLDKLLESGEQ